MMNKPSLRTMLALSVLVFFVSDIQGGIGAILTIYLRSEVGCTTSQICMALAMTGIASAIFLLPSGLLVDITKFKKTLIAVACGSIALSRYIILLKPTFYSILAAQFLFGIAFSILTPAVTAVTMGIVSKRYFPQRAAMNELLFHAGTVFTIVTIGIVSQLYSYNWIIYGTILFSLTALIPLCIINSKEIDHTQARAASSAHTTPMQISKLLTKKSIILFYSAFIIYQVATSALLPLVGQKLAKLDPQHDAITMASCIVLAQIAMVVVAFSLRLILNKTGRKTIFLCGFIFIILRAVLFSMTDNMHYLIATQLLDGLGSGIFGVMSIVIVSDLAEGTGRFNFLVGLLGLCSSIGLAISNFIAGFVSQQYGFSAGFIVLALIALFGFLFSGFILQETGKIKPSYSPRTFKLKYLLR